MVRGVIAGKFLPPHKGHSYLIDYAKSRSDELAVIICDRPEYLIPAELRKEWLEELHPDVRFIVFKDTLDDNDSAGWAEATVRLLGYKPNMVFSSEDYGSRWASCMQCGHTLVDKARTALPVSGTAVRDDPWSNWQYLSEPVRQYFARRICIVGAESSGTTTLTHSLAEHYKTAWVPEYGRQYTADNWNRFKNPENWKTEDFVKIAAEQNRLEDEAARSCNKILFCDTDSFATSIWHRRYLGTRSHEVEALAAGRHYDLYLLTDAGIPFEQDGLRDGEKFRPWMHQEFQEKLKFWGKPFVIISGGKADRLKQAVGLIDSLIEKGPLDLPGVVSNKWQLTGGVT